MTYQMLKHVSAETNPIFNPIVNKIIEVDTNFTIKCRDLNLTLNYRNNNGLIDIEASYIQKLLNLEFKIVIETQNLEFISKMASNCIKCQSLKLQCYERECINKLELYNHNEFSNFKQLTMFVIHVVQSLINYGYSVYDSNLNVII